MGRITKDDRCLIKGLRTEKKWGAKRLLKEFPNKRWSVTSMNRLIKKIDNCGSTERKSGSGRPRSVRTADNVSMVQDMICSQDDAPCSHKSPREIQRETGVSRSSVVRIIKNDLHFKAFKRVVAQKLNTDCKVKRLQRCRQLLARFPSERSVRSIWFTDEKTFTVATPLNSQNDRVYAGTGRKRDVPASRLIREREHFSQKVMVSVGVSRMGKTSVVFVDPGAKINSAYYCQVVLEKGLLSDIRAKCRHHKWTFQQDGAPAHTAHNTVEYLKKENIDFIQPDMWPPNSPDLNPVDYAVWGALQQRVYHGRKFSTVEELKTAIITEWRKLSQRFIDNSINEWRRRLKCVVENDGGHIEHCNLA